MFGFVFLVKRSLYAGFVEPQTMVKRMKQTKLFVPFDKATAVISRGHETAQQETAERIAKYVRESLESTDSMATTVAGVMKLCTSFLPDTDETRRMVTEANTMLEEKEKKEAHEVLDSRIVVTNSRGGRRCLQTPPPASSSSAPPYDDRLRTQSSPPNLSSDEGEEEEEEEEDDDLGSFVVEDCESDERNNPYYQTTHEARENDDEGGNSNSDSDSPASPYGKTEWEKLQRKYNEAIAPYETTTEQQRREFSNKRFTRQFKAMKKANVRPDEDLGVFVRRHPDTRLSGNVYEDFVGLRKANDPDSNRMQLFKLMSSLGYPEFNQWKIIWDRQFCTPRAVGSYTTSCCQIIRPDSGIDPNSECTDEYCLYHCACGYSTKYLFIVQSKDGRATMALGSRCIERHFQHVPDFGKARSICSFNRRALIFGPWATEKGESMAGEMIVDIDRDNAKRCPSCFYVVDNCKCGPLASVDKDTESIQDVLKRVLGTMPQTGLDIEPVSTTTTTEPLQIEEDGSCE